MTHYEVAQFRVHSQRLSCARTGSPKELVSHFGAVQAQDYAMAKWAIGARCGASEMTIEDALNAGEIIRTHLLRPTWHFVAAHDIYWMLELSAPQLKKFTASIAKKYDFDEKRMDRFNREIEKLLSGNNHLTRNEIMQELNVKRVFGQDFQSALIMMNAELEGLVCNGKRKENQITYALLSERVVASEIKYTKEEGLAKLARKYFDSHGPATVADFSWWSGLSVTIAARAVNLIDSELHRIQIENQTYWVGNDGPPDANHCSSVLFLPSFDEFLISYKNREAAIELENQSKAITKNGIFKPIIVEKGQVIGTWKQTVKKDYIQVMPQFFQETDGEEKEVLLEAMERYGMYLETRIVIE